MISAALGRTVVRGALLGLGSLFAAVLWLELGRFPDAPALARPGAIRTEGTIIAPGGRRSAPPPADHYAAILERPLFRADRRPFVAAPTVVEVEPTQAPAPSQPEAFSLSAVVIADDQRLAIIRAESEKKARSLRQGEGINGWILTEVRPEVVSLERAGQVRQVRMSAPRSQRHSAATAPRRPPDASQ